MFLEVDFSTGVKCTGSHELIGRASSISPVAASCSLSSMTYTKSISVLSCDWKISIAKRWSTNGNENADFVHIEMRRKHRCKCQAGACRLSGTPGRLTNLQRNCHSRNNSWWNLASRCCQFMVISESQTSYSYSAVCEASIASLLTQNSNKRTQECKICEDWSIFQHRCWYRNLTVAFTKTT